MVSTGCWKKSQESTVMLDRIVDAYELAYPNLSVHTQNFPEPGDLRSISVMGQTGYGMSDVGEGKDTAGSDLIIEAVDRDDPRPVWVMCGGRV
ncbi:nucleoside hydrolase-like domain-containing protein [Parvularcula sp. LCG005]|uniref:nucleoside hydrolase-like domain-containing protein n=1 Tax=Parvularcula sp. LCG005 TaxID=3078805 RepID=UPI00397C8913